MKVAAFNTASNMVPIHADSPLVAANLVQTCVLVKIEQAMKSASGEEERGIHARLMQKGQV